MDEFVIDKNLLPQEQQQAIDKRLQELNQQAIFMLEQMPEEFEKYIEKALKECNDTMRLMIEKSSDIYNDKKALSYIFVIHKERKRDLERLKEKYLCGRQQPQSLNPEPQQIAKELTTPEAKTYFQKAISLGLMDSNYHWLKGWQMLACFAREMSRKLNMGKGDRIAWKPFEILFKVPFGKLRGNYNDVQKTGQDPKEAYLIDRVFE